MSARRPFKYAADIRRESFLLDEDERRRSAKWVADRLAMLPIHWGQLVAEGHRLRGGDRVAAANAWLLGVTEQGASGRIPISASDDDVRTAAKIAANEARGIAQVVRGGGADVYDSLVHTCGRWNVRPAVPKVKDGECDVMPAVRRMICRRWWLRKLRVEVGQRCEGAAIRAGIVRRGKWAYVSQDSLVRRTCQRARHRQAIEGAILEDADTGEQVHLEDVVSGSVAGNPEIKRGELMVRIRGYDEFAHGQGWRCELWTLTAPSRFHAQTTAGGRGEASNPSFDGSSPRDAQNYLCAVWARARSAWERAGLSVVGLRTVEPHHDGTPHWHLIAYGQQADLERAREILQGYALADSPDEAGAKKRRFVWLLADGLSGASYAAKYLAKNIDGHGMDGQADQETGGKVRDTVKRVEAWAAVWRIRQFQFWGAPAVTLWRTLRRVDQAAEEASELEQARAAADAARWSDFWRACLAGGLCLVKEAACRLTQYGDEAARRPVGVAANSGSSLMLEIRAWVVRWGARRQGAAAGVERGTAGGRSSLVLCG